MRTIINLFVKKFQPDPSKTLWLVCNYIVTTHVAYRLVWDHFSVCNFNTGTENSFLGFFRTKSAGNFRNKSFVRRDNMLVILHSRVFHENPQNPHWCQSVCTSVHPSKMCWRSYLKGYSLKRAETWNVHRPICPLNGFQNKFHRSGIVVAFLLVFANCY